jgi:hypothetical protein
MDEQLLLPALYPKHGNRGALVRRVPCCPLSVGGDQQLDFPFRSPPTGLGLQKGNCGLVR